MKHFCQQTFPFRKKIQIIAIILVLYNKNLYTHSRKAPLSTIAKTTIQEGGNSYEYCNI